MLEFSSPERITHWALAVMTELIESMCDDLSKKRMFAWHLRMRQPRELYIRTLYATLLAGERELHHVLSGAPPNNLTFFYTEVNRSIFHNNGRLFAESAGFDGRPFTPIDNLNQSAHASFRSVGLCIKAKRQHYKLPTPQGVRASHANHHKFLAEMHRLFKAGKAKDEVRTRVIELHQSDPLSIT